MKMKDIRGLSTDELRNRLNDAKEELMRFRFQQSTGELTDTSRMRITRRNIAQLFTVLNQREQNPESEESHE